MACFVGELILRTHTLSGAESGLAAHTHNPAVIVDATPMKWGLAAAGTTVGTLTASGGSNVVYTSQAGPANASSAHSLMQPYGVFPFVIRF